MKTCRDCIHRKVCGTISNFYGTFGENTVNELDCDYFEDKSNYKEVVNCKDCKFVGVKDFAYGYCQYDRGLTGIVKPDDYCSRGEKK